MFNWYKRLKEMKGELQNLIQLNNEEIKDCNSYLKDLPEDITDLQELSVIIGNNKDMARAYDLGRLEALEMIKEKLKEIKKN